MFSVLGCVYIVLVCICLYACVHMLVCICLCAYACVLVFVLLYNCTLYPFTMMQCSCECLCVFASLCVRCVRKRACVLVVCGVRVCLSAV